MSFKTSIVLGVAAAALFAFATPASALTEAECDALGGSYQKGICFVRIEAMFPQGAPAWAVPQPWKTCFDSGKAVFKVGASPTCGTILGKIDQAKPTHTEDEDCPPNCLQAAPGGANANHASKATNTDYWCPPNCPNGKATGTGTPATGVAIPKTPKSAPGDPAPK